MAGFKLDIEQEAINLVLSEKNAWREGEVFLTDRVSFQGRNIIEKSRKNYFGVFDNPYDMVTQRKKMFVPMTRDMVETTVKNIDIDSADISTRAKNSQSINLAAITRYILINSLHKMRFGQILNRVIRKTATEGVAVLKKCVNGKKVVIKLIENLNFYTDPTADYLCNSVANIEENWLTLEETRQYQEWTNLDELSGASSIEKIDGTGFFSASSSKIPYVKITERWGLIPRYFLTGKSSDKRAYYEGAGEYLEGVIIISNLDTGGSGPIVHLIAENKEKKRPFVEFRTKSFDGRWLGIGIGEDLLQLQSYINEIFNIRLNTARIKQLGLFEIRRGSGVTPQALSGLYSGGGILVSRLREDIAELRTGDIKTSSYKDEEEAYLWAQRMTGAWEIGRGESLPANQPATTAVLQERGMKTGFGLQQEELGFSLSKFLEELFLPAILDSISEGEILNVLDNPNELKMLDDIQVNNQLTDKIIDYKEKNGFAPSIQEIEQQKIKLEEDLKKQGKNRFYKLKKSLLDEKKILDSINIYITGEGFNKMVMTQQLNEILMNLSRIPGANIDSELLVKEILDLMGLSGQKYIKPAQPIVQEMPMGEGQEGGQMAMLQQMMQGAGASQGEQKRTGQLSQSEVEQVAQTATPEGTGRAPVPTM